MKELLGEKPMPTSKVTQLVPQSFMLEPASQIIPMAPRPHTPLPTPSLLHQHCKMPWCLTRGSKGISQPSGRAVLHACLYESPVGDQ